ncbi:MAG: DUF3231 family protein [Clostridiales bacterium]|jgi:hypothetical protein|nr:DUF3231 family protein [Clostridiales bacterium]
MEIGNFHIGKSETAAVPTVSIAEATILWDFLLARYKCIEETSIYHNFAHDAEFKEIINRIGLDLLQYQSEKIEKQMDLYGIPLPGRSRKSFRQKDGSELFDDEYMFKQIFEGCQHFLIYVATAIGSSVTNDSLRQQFIDFFNDEVAVFNNLCKYGKLKGWLETPPVYKAD